MFIEFKSSRENFHRPDPSVPNWECFWSSHRITPYILLELRLLLNGQLAFKSNCFFPRPHSSWGRASQKAFLAVRTYQAFLLPPSTGALQKTIEGDKLSGFNRKWQMVTITPRGCFPCLLHNYSSLGQGQACWHPTDPVLLCVQVTRTWLLSGTVLEHWAFWELNARGQRRDNTQHSSSKATTLPPFWPP